MGNGDVKRTNLRMLYEDDLSKRIRGEGRITWGNKEGGETAQRPQWGIISTRDFVKAVIQELELTVLIGIEGAIGKGIG